MSDRQLEGVIELPRSVLVDQSVLGQRFPFHLDDGDAELWFPALPADAGATESHVLESPLPDVPRLSQIAGRDWGHAGFSKYPGHPRPLASWVEKVVFRASVEVDASTKPWDYAYDFGSQFNSWLETVEQWISLWAPGAVSPDPEVASSSRGQFWDSSTDPERLTGWHPSLSVSMVPSASALDRVRLAAAMRRASYREGPPPEWLLLLRARQINDPRTAVIEAATAVEVALVHCLHDRLFELSDMARERIIGGANGLVGLLRLLEGIDRAPESCWARVADRLAEPRNRAVHAGLVPSDVNSALDEATSLLELYAPVPPATYH
jgi:hypothetical protein